MKRWILVSLLGLLPVSQGAAEAQTSLYLLGADQSFLGVVSSDRFAEESICNRFSNYGSRFGEMSMRNRCSDYGSQFSDLSAYNSRAQTPPLLFNDGQPVAIITKNRRFDSKYRIDPDYLFYRTCE